MKGIEYLKIKEDSEEVKHLNKKNKIVYSDIFL